MYPYRRSLLVNEIEVIVKRLNECCYVIEAEAAELVCWCCKPAERSSAAYAQRLETKANRVRT